MVADQSSSVLFGALSALGVFGISVLLYFTWRDIQNPNGFLSQITDNWQMDIQGTEIQRLEHVHTRSHHMGSHHARSRHDDTHQNQSRHHQSRRDHFRLNRSNYISIESAIELTSLSSHQSSIQSTIDVTTLHSSYSPAQPDIVLTPAPSCHSLVQNTIEPTLLAPTPLPTQVQRNVEMLYEPASQLSWEQELEEDKQMYLPIFTLPKKK